MIRSFGDKPTEALFRDQRVRNFGNRPRRQTQARSGQRGKPAPGFGDTAVQPAGEAEGRPEGLPLDPDQRSMAGDLQMDQWRAA